MGQAHSFKITEEHAAARARFLKNKVLNTSRGKRRRSNKGECWSKGTANLYSSGPLVPLPVSFAHVSSDSRRARSFGALWRAEASKQMGLRRLAF